MPNWCEYSMRIKGSKRNISKFCSYMVAGYRYGETAEIYRVIGNREVPTAHHIGYRVASFEFSDSAVEDLKNLKANDEYCLQAWGDCAWSVFSTMFSGEHTYYTDLHKEHLAKYKKDPAWTIPIAAKMLKLDIEIYSTESGNCFAEHYIVNKEGKILKNEETEYGIVFIEDYENEEAFAKVLQGRKDIEELKARYRYAVENGGNYIEICKWLNSEGEMPFTIA